MPELAYVNGAISPVEEATISVRDRGFIFGDGVYDVAKLRGGAPERLGRHLERLRDNAEALGIEGLPGVDEFAA
ncbi:MAG: D-amino acid aminotransferase, partial [Persicimonas sp.]